MLDATSSETAVLNDTVLGVNKEEYRRMKKWLDDRIESSKKQPLAEVITVTPLLARLLLALNKGNRPISLRNADMLASDIANKRWEFNGESMVVSRGGVLIDGQHRCLQVVATGKSIETVIVFGPRDQARYTIDTGRPKSAANFLAMQDFKYATVLAAASGYLVQWQKNNYIQSHGATRPATTSEKLAAVEENAGLKVSVEFTCESTKTVRNHAILSFCHFVFSKKAGRATADEFISKLIDGDGLKKGDPIYYCRNRLIGMARGYYPNDKCELIFKCWNKWRQGSGSVSTFRFTGGELPKVDR